MSWYCFVFPPLFFSFLLSFYECCSFINDKQNARKWIDSICRDMKLSYQHTNDEEEIVRITNYSMHTHTHTHIQHRMADSRYVILLDGRINGQSTNARLGHHLSIVMIRIFYILRERERELQQKTNWNIKAGEINWSWMHGKDIGSYDESDEPKQYI